MQTIRITITSPNPPDIVIEEQQPKKPDVVEKLGNLLKQLQAKQEVKQDEACSESFQTKQ